LGQSNFTNKLTPLTVLTPELSCSLEVLASQVRLSNLLAALPAFNVNVSNEPRVCEGRYRRDRLVEISNCLACASKVLQSSCTFFCKGLAVCWDSKLLQPLNQQPQAQSFPIQGELRRATPAQSIPRDSRTAFMRRTNGSIHEKGQFCGSGSNRTKDGRKSLDAPQQRATSFRYRATGTVRGYSKTASIAAIPPQRLATRSLIKLESRTAWGVPRTRADGRT
jgi:hypothetical protein